MMNVAAVRKESRKLAKRLVLVLAEAATPHEDDPGISLVLATGLLATIAVIDGKAPGFKALVQRMLAEIADDD